MKNVQCENSQKYAVEGDTSLLIREVWILLHALSYALKIGNLGSHVMGAVACDMIGALNVRSASVTKPDARENILLSINVTWGSHAILPGSNVSRSLIWFQAAKLGMIQLDPAGPDI